MNEREKLEEAKYFYSQMKIEMNNPMAFQFNLSAFLSASRSVLQYVLKEAIKNNGHPWYDRIIVGSSISQFFKNKRNINIHICPVKPQKNYAINIHSTLNLSSSLMIKVMNHNNDVIEQRHIKKDERPEKLLKDETTIKIKYRFTDWLGDEDIIELSERYLKELEHIIEDGIKNGFIS